MSTSSGDSSDNVQRVLQKCYEENDFLMGLLNSIIDAKTEQYLSSNGFTFQDADIERLDSLGTPGPNFDIRFAAGMYRIDKNASGAKDLMIHLTERQIYVDGVLIGSYKKTDEGLIEFPITSTHNAKIKFDADPETKVLEFSGTVYNQNDAQTESPITGKRNYPWHDGDETSSHLCQRPSPAAEKQMILASSQSLAMAMQLVPFQQSPQAQPSSPPKYEVFMANGPYPNPLHELGGLYPLIHAAIRYGVGQFNKALADDLAKHFRKAKGKMVEKAQKVLNDFVADIPLNIKEFEKYVERIVWKRVDEFEPDLLNDGTVKEVREDFFKHYMKDYKGSAMLELKKSGNHYGWYREDLSEKYDKAMDEAMRKKFEQINTTLLDQLIEAYIEKKRPEKYHPKIRKLRDFLTKYQDRLKDLTDHPSNPHPPKPGPSNPDHPDPDDSHEEEIELLRDEIKRLKNEMRHEQTDREHKIDSIPRLKDELARDQDRKRLKDMEDRKEHEGQEK